MRVIYTSDHGGQIYVPLVNTIMMLACVLLVMIFEKSMALADAYGLSVAALMLITTILYTAYKRRTGWSIATCLPVAIPIGLVDLAFFLANIPKIPSCGRPTPAMAATLPGATWDRPRGLRAISVAANPPVWIALAGTRLMDTGAIRDGDDRGRHTTTHRELFRLPGGALLVDTPGMREFSVLAGDAALEASFADIVELFPQCRFGDCKHTTEPGCAVLAALADGSLSDERWRAYLKLQSELAFEARKGDPAAEAAHRRHWKQLNKSQRARNKMRRDIEED